MPTLGRMRRRMAKERLGALAQGSSPGSDIERQKEVAQTTEALGAAAAAQAQANQQAAAANAAGAPVVAGALKQQSKQIAEAGQGAAVQAQGAARQAEADRRERREQQTLGLVNQQITQARADLQQGLDATFKAIDLGGTKAAQLLGIPTAGG